MTDRARPRSGCGAVPLLLAAALPVLALSGTAAAGDDLEAELSAAARIGDRPAECGGGASSSVTRWERARVPGLGPYCEALSRGLAALAEAPDKALAAASRAEAALPGRAAPLVLSGRAYARARDFAAAYAAFAGARSRDPRSVGSPGALADLAHAALHGERTEEALAAYRALVPRLAWLPDPRQKIRILVEAAVLSASLGPTHLAEAAGYLLEARRSPQEPGSGDYVLAAQALLAVLGGQPSDAHALRTDGPGPARLEAERTLVAAGKGGASLEVRLADLDSLVAVLSEPQDPELAAERWQSYLGAKAARPTEYETIARAHLEALRRQGRRGR